MIVNVFRICLLRLWHNKAEWVLTFIVPILFFSIFALIFASRGTNGGTPRLKVCIVDEARIDSSKAAVSSLQKLDAFRIYPEANSQEASSPPTRAQATDWVRKGLVNIAIVIAKKQPSKSETIADSSATSPTAVNELQVDILGDSYDQVASQVVTAMVQKSMVQESIARVSIPNDSEFSKMKLDDGTLDLSTIQPGAPQLPEKVVVAKFEASDIRLLPPVQPESTSMGSETLHRSGQGVTQVSGPSLPSFSSPIPIAIPEIRSVDVLGKNKANPAIAMYAAGIAVMFVLFSATASSGVLLEEKENGTLERLLASQLNLDQLLMGKWLYMTSIGFIQVTLMFAWGALVYGLPLVRHWDGFLAMTLVCTSCAASFALILAVACKSRAQLNWVSVVIILAMSALGGSMVPRYLMSESIRNAGMITFNAWALEGYNKVFWRELPLKDLWPELGVLTLSAFVLLIAARGLASSWER